MEESYARAVLRIIAVYFVCQGCMGQALEPVIGGLLLFGLTPMFSKFVVR